MKNFCLSITMLLSLAVTAQVPVMSSLDAASAPTIFLDFDGHTVNGTQWNTAGPIACGPANLTSAQITQVYNRIAEDYRPFNVNVTTDSTKYWSAPAKMRTRVIFTISNAWYGSSVGGVSYINSFTWGDNTPCFVFTALLNYNLKMLGEAGAHEAGHTLGLRHQASYDAACAKITDYNRGTGTGEIGWAPIMGVGYYQNFTTWNLGPTSLGCTTVQNDLTTITKAANGITFRTDDHRGSFDSASLTPVINNQINVSGIVSRTEDQDMFRFSLPKGGRLQLNAVPYNIGSNNAGSNLDLQVQLFTADGRQLGSYNPAPLLNSVIDTTLESGIYYLMVDGKGNQFASEYGSLGSYALSGTFQEFIVLPLRQLTLSGQSVYGARKLQWTVDADENVVDQLLQVSTDGTTYSDVAQLNGTDRKYIHYTSATASARYRLRIKMDNGKQYYSNVVLLRDAQSARPRLVQNKVQGSMLQVEAQALTAYVVSDYSGRVLASGKIAGGVGSIQLPSMANGIYLLRLSDDTGNYVEKFVKQ
jgi:hypothetical protein